MSRVSEAAVGAPVSPALMARLSPGRHVAMMITALGAGGAERVMVTMANNWAASGVKVTLVTYEAPAAESFYAVHDKVAIIRLGLESENRWHSKGPVLTVRRIRALRMTLRQLNPDVAIAFLTKVNIATLLAAFGLSLPIIVSERNHPDRQDLGPFWRWLRRRTYPHAAAIICQTERAKRCYPSALQRRVTVIPNPVRPLDPAKAPETKRQLTAVGRLTPQKGFDLLLEAFANIAGDFPDWRLVVWGEGPARDSLSELCARLGLNERVSLPGLTATAGAWIEETGIFVLSSRYEGMPNVLLEAMAAGLPVVAFDCPLGPDELIDHGRTGLLVPAEDVDRLAEALARLMIDQDLRASLAANAAQAIRDYQIDPIMGRWSAAVLAALPGSEAAPAENPSHLRKI